jgi:hypothetical protein
MPNEHDATNGTGKDEWIGVAEVAEEMHYTNKVAWKIIRSIGLVGVNTRKMHLVRFTRVEFDAAIERAKAPLPPRARTGALASALAGTTTTKNPGTMSAAAIAAARAKLREA